MSVSSNVRTAGAKGNIQVQSVACNVPVAADVMSSQVFFSELSSFNVPNRFMITLHLLIFMRLLWYKVKKRK